MSIYDKNGSALLSAYNASGSAIASAFDKNGNVVWGSGHIDPTPSNEYEQVLLNAKNAWKAEYEADSTIIPFVLHTDQHGALSGSTWQGRFDFLADAVEWNNVAGCINLGDVTDYNLTNFQGMQTCLSPIPAAKKINLWGNHDTWDSSWTQDQTAVPSQEIWNNLKTYFNNSAYNGYQFFPDTKCSQYMIDSQHGVKFVCAGGWDYDRTLGGYSHYVMDSDNVDSLIQMLSAVDNYDIIFLSHIQPMANNTGMWIEIYDDGNSSASPITSAVQAIVNESDTKLNQIFLDRMNKSNGTVKDSYGNTHSYDFRNCTSDLICCLAGHEHAHRYASFSGLNVTVFDALYYDQQPFYFVNIDRTNNKMITYRVDTTPRYIRSEIPI